MLSEAICDKLRLIDQEEQELVFEKVKDLSLILAARPLAFL